MIFIKNLFRICNLIYIPIALLAFSLSILVRLFLDKRKPEESLLPRPSIERIDCPVHGVQPIINFECDDSVAGQWKIGPYCFRCYAEACEIWIRAVQRKHDNDEETKD